MRSALALADGTIDALVSDHTPVDEDAKTLPFAESEPGATGVELLLSLALKWAGESGVDLARALAVVTSGPAGVLARPGRRGSVRARAPGRGWRGRPVRVRPGRRSGWSMPGNLRSQGKHTPFSGYALQARVCCTIVGGYIAFDA